MDLGAPRESPAYLAGEQNRALGALPYQRIAVDEPEKVA